MSAVQIHLSVVHIPLVCCGVAFIALLLGLRERHVSLQQFGYGLLVASGIASAVAYYSGPGAHEVLDTTYGLDPDLAESHALMGRVSFVGMIVLGVASLSALLQFLKGERPPGWLRWTLAALALALVYVLAWTSHLGGQIRHPEARIPTWMIFPDLP